MLHMANTIEALDAARESMIKAAMLPVMDMVVRLDNHDDDGGVSVGDVTKVAQKLYPGQFGMGIIPEALDALVTDGFLIDTATPFDPTKNGHVIGKYDWQTLGYHVAEPLQVIPIAQ
jgi:hypothetical protein